MLGCFSAGSRRSRLLARLAGPVTLALLLSLFSLVCFPHTAHAAHASGGCPPQLVCSTVYTHTSTAANTAFDYTLLDNPVSNNNPNAFIEVTANWNPNGVYTNFDNHQVGVWFDRWAGKWGIFNEDGSSMPIGVSFNVSVTIVADTPENLVQTVTSSNTQGYITFLNLPYLNGYPGATLLVTQNWNPGGNGDVYNPHPIGVWYDPYVNEWTIYNEDRSPLPIGASFNVENTQVDAINTITQVATTANTFGDSTCFNFPYANNPQAGILITHIYSGYFTDVSAVWYDSYLNEWCVFDGSYNSMPIGATFFVSLIAV